MYPDLETTACARFGSRNVGAVEEYPGMQVAADGVERQLATAGYPLPWLVPSYAASAEIHVRRSPMVADSLADTRARSKLGIAIAAIMPMIATTIKSSMSVNPFCLFINTAPFTTLAVAVEALARGVPRGRTSHNSLIQKAKHPLAGGSQRRQLLTTATNCR